MDFEQNLAEIRQTFDDRLQKTFEEVIGYAVAMLREDIQNPQLNNINVPPDAFMFRANQIGLALLQQGFFAIAERLYRILVNETLKYRERTGDWRHAGALYANTAVACAAQRNLDQAVVQLLKAAQEDIQTYKIAPENSFAITDLLQEYFGNPVRNVALNIAQTVNPDITSADVENLCQFLGEREYAFLSYTYIASAHMEANQQFPNDYSQLQLFSALRSLCALLEIELKAMTGNMQTTFFPTLESLYGTKNWWSTFDSTRLRIRGPRKAVRPDDDQLQDAFAITPTDDVSTFWKSLLIGYIVRNYTTHQMEIRSALVQSHLQETFAHILHVMITASQY